MEGLASSHQLIKQRLSPHKLSTSPSSNGKQNQVHPQVGAVILYGVPIVSLVIESQERLCLAQISNTLLKQFSYNEIHNRRVALGITCVQCTPVQLEILRRAGAMPVSSRRCGMITRREAERLCKSFLGDNAPPRLPDDFAFSVHHECAWGCRGAFLPARYNSSRAKCIKCSYCGLFFSPNKFIFHSHRTSPNATYVQPDAANFNSWRRHMKLSGSPPQNIVYAWEDVKAMFNGGTRKRMMSSGHAHSENQAVMKPAPLSTSPTPNKQIKMDSPPQTPVPYPPPTPTPTPLPIPHRVPPFPDLPLPITMMDYVYGLDGLKPPFLSPYLPWFGSAKRSVLSISNIPSPGATHDEVLQHISSLPHYEKMYHQSAFRPVYPAIGHPHLQNIKKTQNMDVPKKFTLQSRKNCSPLAHEERHATYTDQRDVILTSDDNTQHCLSESPKVVLKHEMNDESSESNDSLRKEDDKVVNHIPGEVPDHRSDLLKAVSLIKNEERDTYSRVSAQEEGREGEDHSSSDVLEGNTPSGGGHDEDEDETVDIETTDDVHESSPVKPLEDRFRVADNDSLRHVSRSPEPLNHRIWTIARFSLEQPPRYRYDKPGYRSEKYLVDEDCSTHGEGVMNLATARENPVANKSKLDCLTCCPQPLSTFRP